MPDKPENQPAETEKGFGHGLRAQLQRRREEDDDAQEAAPTNVELRFELTARPAGGEGESTVVSSDMLGLKSELEAAQRREASLRLELEKRTEAFDEGITSEKDLMRRAATLDEREAKLAEFEVDLEDRERRVRDQREAIEEEHARVADLQAELAAEQQLAAEQMQQAEMKMREAANFDRSHDKARSDLAKKDAALDDRLKKLEKKESEPS